MIVRCSGRSGSALLTITDRSGAAKPSLRPRRARSTICRDVLPRTGVIFVPGSGFGPSLTNGVRISYGPLVNDLDRIEEGFRRVGRYLGR